MFGPTLARNWRPGRRAVPHDTGQREPRGKGRRCCGRGCTDSRTRVNGKLTADGSQIEKISRDGRRGGRARRSRRDEELFAVVERQPHRAGDGPGSVFEARDAARSAPVEPQEREKQPLPGNRTRRRAARPRDVSAPPSACGPRPRACGGGTSRDTLATPPAIPTLHFFEACRRRPYIPRTPPSVAIGPRTSSRSSPYLRRRPSTLPARHASAPGGPEGPTAPLQMPLVYIVPGTIPSLLLDRGPAGQTPAGDPPSGRGILHHLRPQHRFRSSPNP